jgi:hypothetical protein
MRDYPEPSFLKPLNSVFVYVAWRVDPVRLGPFVRPSAVRSGKIGEFRGIAESLVRHAEVVGVRLFETSFIPPLPGMPIYDVFMLVETATRDAASAVVDERWLKEADPALVFLATNAARFGVTDNGDSRTNILLNHFTGTSNRPDAVAAWRQLSAWFAAKTGVDNSTLLQTEESAPYVLVNYARLPAAVIGFLVGQLLRPSFYRYVRVLLKRNHLRSLPLFVRNVPIGSADA